MKAIQVKDAIIVLYEATIEGSLVIETPCKDFDMYASLPEVVSYKGIDCGKTGWSSDTYKACYKQSAMIAYKVK